MSIDEEMAYEDFMGIPRATRGPLVCECGKKFMTQDVYFTHRARCPVAQKAIQESEQERKPVVFCGICLEPYTLNCAIHKHPKKEVSEE